MGGERDPLEALGGSSLRVYLYLLRAGRPVGVREVQRALGFRSPSTALHHLRRLESMGLVVRSGDGYVALKPKGLLSLYTSIAGRLLPRTLIASSAATGALIGYIMLGARDPLALAIISCLTAYLWLHTYSLARHIRSMQPEDR